MKAVLISINPKWISKICNKIGERDGKPLYEKTVEIRKTKPKTDVPFKCYIYCTSSNVHECLMQNESGVKLICCINYKTAIPCGGEIANGKVIGEFVCDRIDDFYCASVPYRKENNLGYGYFVDNGVYKVDGWHEGVVFERSGPRIDTMLKNTDLENMCLSAQELFDYIGIGKHLYGWHISDLKIYDKPKELSEFRRECDYEKDCGDCPYLHIENTPSCYETWCEVYEHIPLSRPPQSWCYVEV